MTNGTLPLRPDIETSFGLDQIGEVLEATYHLGVDSLCWHDVDEITMQIAPFGGASTISEGPWHHNDRMGMMPARVPGEMLVWATSGLVPEWQFQYDHNTDEPQRPVRPTGFTATLTYPRENVPMVTIKLVIPETEDEPRVPIHRPTSGPQPVYRLP